MDVAQDYGGYDLWEIQQAYESEPRKKPVMLRYYEHADPGYGGQHMLWFDTVDEAIAEGRRLDTISRFEPQFVYDGTTAYAPWDDDPPIA